MPTRISALHRLPREDIRPAAAALARAFEHDPIWARAFAGIPLEKAMPWYEGPLRYGLRYGRVYATSDRLEGVVAVAPRQYADMTAWRSLRSGMLRVGLRMPPRMMMRVFRLMRDFRIIEAHRREHMGERDYIYVMIVGVDPEHQGVGQGSKLLRALTEESDQTGVPIYLETETEENVRMYEHLGFEVLREIELPVAGFPLWEMLREPAG